MKKIIVFCGVVLGILVIVLLVNSYYGNIFTRDVETFLEKSFEAEGVSIQYANLSVKPLLRKIELKDAIIIDRMNTIKAKKIEYVMSLKKLIEWSKNKSFEALEDIKILIKNITIENSIDDSKIYISDLKVRGHLTMDSANNVSLDLTEDHILDFDIRDMKFDLPDFAIENLSDDLKENLIFNNIHIKMVYDASEQKFLVEDLKLKSPFLNGSGFITYDLVQTDDNDLLVEEIDGNIDFNLNGKKILLANNISLTFNSLNCYGKINLIDNVKSGKFTFTEDMNMIKNGKTGAELKDLQISLPSEMLRQVSLSNFNNNFIKVDRLSLECNFQSPKVAYSIELDSSYLQINLDVEMTNDGFEPYINIAKLTISDMSQPVVEFIENIEYVTTQRFPRDSENNIVIKYSGYLRNLDFMGLL